MSGNLIVRPLSAKLTHGTEFFGKMDPLVKVIVGSHVQRTPAMRRGHKNPNWDTELSLRRTGEDVIRFEVWDKDIISKNDLIGSGELLFSKIFQSGGVFKDWVPLFYKNKSAGDLLVSIEFIPDYGVDMKNLGSVSNYSTTTQPTSYMGTVPTSGTVGTTGTTLGGPIVGGSTIGTSTYNPSTVIGTSTYTPTPTKEYVSPYSVPTQYSTTQPTSTQTYTTPLRESSYGQYTTQNIQSTQPMQSSFPVSTREGYGYTSVQSSSRPTEQLGDLERKREMEEGYVPTSQFYPGYTSGIVGYTPIIGAEGGYTPVIGTEGNYTSENRYVGTEGTYTTNRYDTPTYNTRTGYYQPTASTTNYPTEVSPKKKHGIVGELDNIRHRITSKLHHPKKDTENVPVTQPYGTSSTMGGYVPTTSVYSNVKGTSTVPTTSTYGYSTNVPTTTTTGYVPTTGTYDLPLEGVLQEKRSYSNVQEPYYTTTVVENVKGYLPTQGSVGTQLPGVLSNPPVEEAGKYVVHQGGTHSQVGSVQSHRVISQVIDRPSMTTADLDKESKIALGDVPQTYYGETR